VRGRSAEVLVTGAAFNAGTGTAIAVGSPGRDAWPVERTRVERFYVRLQTPVGPTLEDDAKAVQASYENPTRYDHLKLFPKTNWELTKWNRQDTLGFLSCCGLVIVVLAFFKFVLVAGS
jgi:hypothetical protein